MISLESIVSNSTCNADDYQLYISFSMSTNEAVSSMDMAIHDIRAWYAAKMLTLNDDKTEMLVIDSK